MWGRAVQRAKILASEALELALENVDLSSGNLEQGRNHVISLI